MRRLRALLLRKRGTVLLEGAGAFVTLAVVLMAPGDGPTGTARVELSRAAGTLSLTNSREGMAIFRGANMRPGQQAGGSVRVTNTGTLPAQLTLAPSVAAGGSAASGLLAARLRLVVSDVTDGAHPTTVYAGPLGTMRATSLGALAAGRGRAFLFVSSLPDGGAGDNAVQGATLTAGFSWTANADAPAVATPTPTPEPPVPTPAPTVAPTPTPAPPAGTCAPRKLRIRIKTHGRKIMRITVRVGHKRPHKVKPRRTITVKVKGALPAKVKVLVKLSGGRHAVIRRRVPGC
jgi:spore coat-associated protein N